MSTFIQALTNQSFFQNILLLLLAAALTGLLVPYIKARIDIKDAKRQKLFEESLSRQGKLIDYQTKLLDDLDKLLWEYQFLALEPSYFKMRGNEEGYKNAFKQYDEKAPILLGKIRSQLSKVRRFASSETYQAFEFLHYKKFIPLDGWLIELAEKGTSSHGDWTDNHNAYYAIGIIIDDTLHLLAKDFGFAKENLSHGYNPTKVQKRQ